MCARGARERHSEGDKDAERALIDHSSFTLCDYLSVASVLGGSATPRGPVSAHGPATS